MARPPCVAATASEADQSLCLRSERAEKFGINVSEDTPLIGEPRSEIILGCQRRKRGLNHDSRRSAAYSARGRFEQRGLNLNIQVFSLRLGGETSRRSHA